MKPHETKQRKDLKKWISMILRKKWTNDQKADSIADAFAIYLFKFVNLTPETI